MECFFIGTNRRFWCSSNKVEPNSGQFSILDVAIKSPSTDAVLNVMIALPLFIFRLRCYKIKTFPIGCLSLLKQEAWWIMAHLPHPALSSSLEMMHDLNFTEGKQKCVDPPRPSRLCSPLASFRIACCADWRPGKEKFLSTKYKACL